jgi:hypothetical protein
MSSIRRVQQGPLPPTEPPPGELPPLEADEEQICMQERGSPPPLPPGMSPELREAFLEGWKHNEAGYRYLAEN